MTSKRAPPTTTTTTSARPRPPAAVPGGRSPRCSQPWTPPERAASDAGRDDSRPRAESVREKERRGSSPNGPLPVRRTSSEEAPQGGGTGSRGARDQDARRVTAGSLPGWPARGGRAGKGEERV